LDAALARAGSVREPKRKTRVKLDRRIIFIGV
jgi:hypothetical protein